MFFKPLSANLIKWSNTLKQFVGNLPTNFLNVFDRYMGLGLKGLSSLNINTANEFYYKFLTITQDKNVDEP